jgi:hypothetical protein
MVGENSSYNNEIQALDREKQEHRRMEERLRKSESALEELKSKVHVMFLLGILWTGKEGRM